MQNTCYVVGTDFYNVTEIEDYVDHYGNLTKILPQEGFIDLILFGNDWWLEETSKLNACLEHHPGLQYAKSLEGAGSFQWPSTYSVCTGPSHDSSGIDSDYAPDSILSRHGYLIWKNGRLTSAWKRRLSLKESISCHGLQEVADKIAHFCRTYRRQGRNPNAVATYEKDLSWMKVKFYDGKFLGFVWPG